MSLRAARLAESGTLGLRNPADDRNLGIELVEVVEAFEIGPARMRQWNSLSVWKFGT